MFPEHNVTPISGITGNDTPEDPKVIKLAKLILILADKETPIEDKFGCLRLAILHETVSQEDAVYLWANLAELEDFL